MVMAVEDELSESIAATQSSLGTWVTSPRLQERLLRRPPIRFLRDVFARVAATGCGDGLFTATELELHGGSDAALKLHFFTRLVAFVAFNLSAVDEGMDVTGMAEARKIVCGLDAHRTNQLLQQLHLVATDPSYKAHWASSQQRALAGEHPLRARPASGGPAPPSEESYAVERSRALLVAALEAASRDGKCPKEVVWEAAVLRDSSKQTTASPEWSPLHVAAFLGHTELVQRILKLPHSGGQLLCVNPYGQTPADIAALWGRSHLFQLLHTEDSDPEVATSQPLADDSLLMRLQQDDPFVKAPRVVQAPDSDDEPRPVITVDQFAATCCWSAYARCTAALLEAGSTLRAAATTWDRHNTVRAQGL